MSTMTRLDECLSKRNDHLFVEDCDATPRHHAVHGQRSLERELF